MCDAIKKKILAIFPSLAKEKPTIRYTDLDELDLNVVRYKPVGLDTLTKQTQFTRKELQIMYRGFKQECPTGIVNEETFKEIYCQFFPQGDAGMYAHNVFRTFDKDRTGSITFEQFVNSLSVLCRGTVQEKLLWAFKLYDVNGDGIITKPEMVEVVTSIYELLGRNTDPPVVDSSPRDHVDKVFQKLDTNRDGIISEEEFMLACQNEHYMLDSIGEFDTTFY